MNIIEQTLNSPLEFNDILYTLIALIIWYIIWHLIIVKLFSKCDLISDLMRYGPLGSPLLSFTILLFLYVLAILFIGSIQAAFSIGVKIIFRLLIFWGVVITFFVILIKNLKK